MNEDQTTQPIIQPTEIPIPQMAPKKNNLPLILGGAVTILILVAASVYAGMRIQEKKSQGSSVTPGLIINNNLPTSQAGLITCGSCPKFTPPSPDFCQDGRIVPGEKNKCGCQMPPTCDKTTANWKTYTNTKYGFEFKYPLSLTNTQPANEELVDLLFVGPTQKASGRTQTEMFDGMRIRIYVNEVNPNNLKSYVEEQRANSEKSVKDFSEGKVSSISPINIGSTDGFLYDVEGYGNNREVYFPLKDKILLISLLHAGSSELDLGYLDIFDQILSTFKFLK